MTKCIYEKTGRCPKLLAMANDSFQDNVQDLLSICQQFLDGKTSQEAVLTMIDVCKERLRLVSDKVVDKVLKDYKKMKDQNRGR